MNRCFERMKWLRLKLSQPPRCPSMLNRMRSILRSEVRPRPSKIAQICGLGCRSCVLGLLAPKISVRGGAEGTAEVVGTSSVGCATKVAAIPAITAEDVGVVLAARIARWDRRAAVGCLRARGTAVDLANWNCADHCAVPPEPGAPPVAAMPPVLGAPPVLGMEPIVQWRGWLIVGGVTDHCRKRRNRLAMRLCDDRARRDRDPVDW